MVAVCPFSPAPPPAPDVVLPLELLSAPLLSADALVPPVPPALTVLTVALLEPVPPAPVDVVELSAASPVVVVRRGVSKLGS